jgi:Zn-dependent M16 (insulinase) family peptidase
MVFKHRYSEMQSVENEGENVVERAIHRLIYPNTDCGYRYETGGMLQNLRTSTSHQKVCNYHNEMYRPGNMALIIVGQIDCEEVIAVLDKFEQKLLSKKTDRLRLTQPVFSRPITPLSISVQQTVFFPCDDEACSNGQVSV